jgi:hypothetical protein
MCHHLPAGEVIKERALVLDENGDIDVAVMASVSAEPGVDCPAAAESPRRAKSGHELDDGCDRGGYAVRRLV